MAMNRRLAVVALAIAGGLASCDRPADGPAGREAPPKAAAFSHAAEMDLSGYYMPLAEVRIGDWRLDHLFLGQQTDFQGWQAGGRSATFAPVMLQFEDVASPMAQTELGATRSGTQRVLPSAYTVTDDRVRFEGTGGPLGPVRFEGRLDAGALATARRNLGDEGVVLTGTLTAGGQTVRGVQLRWWAGD
jgi:hypothetical protein